jgi:membrane-associated progesterone receptor component
MWRAARPVVASATAGAGAVGVLLGLDYATMSEGRHARGWSVESALLRCRNLAVRRIPAAYDTQYDLVQLAQHDGRRGARTLLAAGGTVWDVSSSEAFRDGGPYEMFAGRDATLALAHMRLEPADVSCTAGWKELGAEAEANLASWCGYFDERYRQVGVLREWHLDEPLERAGERLLVRNRGRPGVTTLPSGVQYETLADGDGPSVAPRQRSGGSGGSGAGEAAAAGAMLLEAHYCVCRADGIRLADSAAIEDGQPVAISTSDLEPGAAAHRPT